MIIIDTNAFLRFFLNDNKAKAAKVKKLLAVESTIYVPDVVLPEIEYILVRGYGKKRTEMLPLYNFIFKHSSLILTQQAKVAWVIYQTTTHDMADCLVAAASLGGRLASFDRKLLRVKGVKRYWR